MEEDEPPDSEKTPKDFIKINGNKPLSPGEAFYKIMLYERTQRHLPTIQPRNLLSRFYTFIFPPKQISQQEHDEIEQRLEEIETQRYQTGEKVPVSENPYLIRDKRISL